MTHMILVIDGQPTQRDVLCTIIKDKLSYDAIGFSTSQQAANYLRNSTAPRIDLMLADVSNADNGCETIAHLRTITPLTPLIALVKYGDYEMAMAALKAGAQDFLDKPVALERLKTTFRNCLILGDEQRKASPSEHAGRPDTLPSISALPNRPLLPISFLGEDGHVRRIDELEAEAIRLAMQYYDGRMTEVARRLGIGRSTLYRKISDLGVRLQEKAA